MNWWDLDQVDFNEKGNYFTPGNYLARVESIRPKKGFKGHSLIMSFIVESADNDTQPGEHRDTVIKLDGENARMSLGDLKSFVFGMFGLNKEDRSQDAIASQIAARMGLSDNPLMGMLVGVEAFDIDVKPSAKNPSGKFTKLRWHTQANERTATQILALPRPVEGGPPAAGQHPPPPLLGPLWGAPPSPPAPPAPERYYPEGSAPGRGATHRMVNGAWVAL